MPDFSRFTCSPGGWEEAMEDFRFCGAHIVLLGGAAMKFDTLEERTIARQMVTYAAFERE